MLGEPKGRDPRRKSPLGSGQRGFMEIIYSILEVCEGGALKTHVMYRCNLNSRQVTDYLDHMLRLGLIEGKTTKTSAKRFLVVTERGALCLRAYRTLIGMLTVKDKGSKVELYRPADRRGRQRRSF
jgi:predicted transcriptional regulator